LFGEEAGKVIGELDVVALEGRVGFPEGEDGLDLLIEANYEFILRIEVAAL
jgi:hypothetical protein